MDVAVGGYSTIQKEGLNFEVGQAEQLLVFDISKKNSWRDKVP